MFRLTRIAVRLALDDQITCCNLLQVSRDAIELNKKFGSITRNTKAMTCAARETTSACGRSIGPLILP